jgi:integrase
MSGGNAKKCDEVLSTALEHAARTDLIRTAPTAKLRSKPKASPPELSLFTREEVSRIREAAVDTRLGALFILAIATGAREGELLALQWPDIDFERRLARIVRALAAEKGGGFRLKEPKSERGRRTLELPAFAVEALHEHRKAMVAEGNAAAPVFSTKTGNYLGKSNFIRQVYRPMLARAGVRYRKFHTFRHTHASDLLAAGRDLVWVAARLGDTKEVVLKTYSHLIHRQDGGDAQFLDCLYGTTLSGNGQGGVKVDTSAETTCVPLTEKPQPKGDAALA